MKHESRGFVRVPAPGTPVSALGSLYPIVPHLGCHGIMFEAIPDNTGFVYIGKLDMSTATGYELLAILAVPTINFLPTFSAAITIEMNGLALEQYFIDAEQPNDGVLVTFLQA